MKQTFHIVSLGCAKNTVDSDSMAQLLIGAGYSQVAEPHRARVIIVNTCGFISPARDESLGVLRDLARKKKPGQVLIAAGCLTQLEGTAITAQVKGLDGVIGTRRWMDIIDVVGKLRPDGHPEPYFHLPEAATTGKDEHGTRRVSIQGASAYLKIADGCRRPCAFCSIPLIKGTTVSRPPEAIIAEAVYLQEQGVREIILIAQDTTDYGYDLGIKNGLEHLLLKITAAAPRVDWIRVMYAYPGYVSAGLIDVMSNLPQVLHYLDIPLQHAHPTVLRRMQRPSGIAGVRKTLEKMRRLMPDLALRTTFIVGFPGETETEFQTLLDFVAETRFDRVGVFKFSLEPFTACAALGDTVPEAVKEDRRQRLMKLQQQISLERNRELVGKDLRVLIEGKGQGVSVGRSYRDAPEIDGLIIVKGEMLPGQIVPVRIRESMPYDLSGEVIVTENGLCR